VAPEGLAIYLLALGAEHIQHLGSLDVAGVAGVDQPERRLHGTYAHRKAFTYEYEYYECHAVVQCSARHQ